MKSYDGMNNCFGTHTIKVTFQGWQYKGYMFLEMGGNCSGMDVFPDVDTIIDSVDNAEYINMEFNLYDDEDWLGEIVLTADNGDTCLFELENERDVEELIIGVEIVNFIKDE